MGFLAMILGPLMRMLYQMIPNFAVTMIVFTVIIKLLMLPLMIKQQKSMAKMSVFTPMINEIQQKYKNNQEKMQEEMVKFQQEYGYSPTAGCLPMLVNMLVLFGMVEVVYRPVQYILGIPKEAISAACTALGIANNGAASQTGLIEAIHAGLASGKVVSGGEGFRGFSKMVARMGTDRMGARECYREVILDNIEYSYLVQDSHIDREQLDEIVDLIVDTVCSARKVIRIAGDDYPAEVVKSRFMKLDSSHVQYVMDCMKDNTTYVRNIKKYLLAALYNAPTTINSYYSSLVQHDMYGDGQRGRG